jgi:hypothetical protein
MAGHTEGRQLSRTVRLAWAALGLLNVVIIPTPALAAGLFATPFVLYPAVRIWRSKGRVSSMLWIYCSVAMTAAAAFGVFGVFNYWGRREAIGAAIFAVPMCALAAAHWSSEPRSASLEGDRSMKR